MKTTKLAAVLFSKIANFDRLLNEDNHRALRLLELYKNLLEGILEEHNGECMDKTGEEYLVIFTSAVNAIQFAMHFELAVLTYNKGISDNKDKFQICIGIHLGEIWQDEGHVYGNGINIAARVMQAAEPGNILVSEDIERQVANKLDIKFTEYEHAKLKNIERDLRVFRLGGDDGGRIEEKRDREPRLKEEIPTMLSGKPSAPSKNEEPNPMAYISEYFDPVRLTEQAAGIKPNDFRKHIRETIRTTVAEAMRKSLQAAELAENNPGTSVVVNDQGEFINTEEKDGDLNLTINLGMSKLENKLRLANQRLDGLITRSEKPPKQSPEEARLEAKGIISQGVVKFIGGLGLGIASIFAYLKFDSFWWLVGGAVIGLFPALSSIKRISLGIAKYQKAKFSALEPSLRGSRRKG